MNRSKHDVADRLRLMKVLRSGAYEHAWEKYLRSLPRTRREQRILDIGSSDGGQRIPWSIDPTVNPGPPVPQAIRDIFERNR